MVLLLVLCGYVICLQPAGGSTRDWLFRVPFLMWLVDDIALMWCLSLTEKASPHFTVLGGFSAKERGKQ